MGNKKTAMYIRLSDEDNNVDGIVKAESNSAVSYTHLCHHLPPPGYPDFLPISYKYKDVYIHF